MKEPCTIVIALNYTACPGINASFLASFSPSGGPFPLGGQLGGPRTRKPLYESAICHPQARFGHIRSHLEWVTKNRRARAWSQGRKLAVFGGFSVHVTTGSCFAKLMFVASWRTDRPPLGMYSSSYGASPSSAVLGSPRVCLGPRVGGVCSP